MPSPQGSQVQEPWEPWGHGLASWRVGAVCWHAGPSRAAAALWDISGLGLPLRAVLSRHLITVVSCIAFCSVPAVFDRAQTRQGCCPTGFAWCGMLGKWRGVEEHVAGFYFLFLCGG